MPKYLLVVFSLLALAGCSNYNSIAKAHTNETIAFKLRPIENASSTSNKSFKIVTVSIDDNAIPGGPEFVKTKSLIVPLAVFNYWDHRTDYRIGRYQFESPLETGIKNAFEVGLGQFGYRYSDTNPDFEVRIRVRKISPKANFGKSGFFYFVLVAYGYNYGNTKGPYQSQLALDIETLEAGRRYTTEIEAGASLPLSLFRDDTNPEIERINRALSLSLNDAVKKYAAVAPK